MEQLIIGSILLSLLHAVIPNHWLPIIAVGRKERWTTNEVTKVTMIAAIAHAASTILLGFILAFLGAELAEHIKQFTGLVAPLILIGLGLLFIYRHHTHQHFHLDEINRERSKAKIIAALVVAMFFSPCIEIEAYFLLAGTHPQWVVWFISLVYATITTSGMLFLVRFAYQGSLKLNWHSLEHNAGIITGGTLVATGIITFFIE